MNSELNLQVELNQGSGFSTGGNAKLRYQITSGNTGGVFDVEPEVGTIFVAQPLDYERNKRYGVSFDYYRHLTLIPRKL